MSLRFPVKFCSQCGSGDIADKIPEGDNRPRYVCESCGFIHYQNPRIVVGCLPVSGDKVLLAKRAIEPQKGWWTIPGGFMENGETLQAGGERETWEEAEAKVKGAELYRIFDLPHIGQVYMFFRGDLDGGYGVGEESLETKLFGEDEIPWSRLAFPVITDVLLEFFEDRKRGEYPVRISEPGPMWAKHLKLGQSPHGGDSNAEA